MCGNICQHSETNSKKSRCSAWVRGSVGEMELQRKSVFLPAGFVAGGEFLDDLLDAEALGGEQHDEVIEHVGGLVDEAFVGAVAGFEAGFKRFLAHFLGHAVDAIAEEAGGVGAFGHFLMALVDEVLQFGEEEDRAGFVGLSPAGICAGVADRAMRRGLNEEGIVITIDLDADDIEVVTAGFALGPEALAAAAVEAHAAGFLSSGVGFGIHVAQHEHLAGGRVLNDGGHQAAAFIEINGHNAWIMQLRGRVYHIPAEMPNLFRSTAANPRQLFQFPREVLSLPRHQQAQGN